MNTIMPNTTRAAGSTRTRRPLDNLRCAIAWRISNTGRHLQTFAHRFSDGDTPAPDAVTRTHPYKVSNAAGLRSSALVKLIEDHDRLDALR